MSEYCINVIVVEDEKLIAKNIAKHIEQGNPHFKVTHIFSNGADAWNHISVQPPQLVITDISMPIMDGIELVKKINESKKFIYCVILTGYAEFAYAQSAVRYGVSDYLLKPVNSHELHQTLNKIELAILADNKDMIQATHENTYKPEEIVSLVKEYIQKHYANDITLNTISQNLGFSSSYLTKVFNKVMGITPSKFIRDYRMNIAKQLLNEPGSSINAVSAAIGYSDPFHFSKSFKQTFGISPSEYKNTVQSKFT